MNRPTVSETLEPRLLLAATLLPGETATFDFDTNGVDDAILVNTGTSAIEYDEAGGDGLTVNLLADGAKFLTNTWAQIDDADPLQDFGLDLARLGTTLNHAGQTFSPIAGASSVTASTIGLFKVGAGNLLSATASVGDIDVLLVEGDITGSVNVAGGIGELVADRINGGAITVAGTIGELATNAITNYAYIQAASAGELLADSIDGGATIIISGAMTELIADAITDGAYVQAGQVGTLRARTIDGQALVIVDGDLDVLRAKTIQDATIVIGGDVQKFVACELIGSSAGTTVAIEGDLGLLRARTISGGQDYSSLSISVTGGVNRLVANTITGGINGSSDITIGDGLGRLNVGLLEGGEASDYGFAQTSLNVTGDIDKICAGLITGGLGNGFAMLSVNVYASYDDAGEMVDAGDIGSLRAAAVTGGEMSDGGEAMVMFNIDNDLTCTRIGQLVGSGSTEPIADPSVYFNAGHDVGVFVAGSITAGTATGDYAYAAVWVIAGNDIHKVIAGTIDAGTAEGDYATVEVHFDAGHDIGSITANTISGGVANGEGALAGVYFEAARNINGIAAGLISGTQSTRPVRTPDPTVRFIAGGDIGTVIAGRITGGEITADGDAVAVSSVVLRADGTYVDEAGVQSAGNIERIITGTITGGSADGANALSYVKISAANDIQSLCADRISGGSADNGAFSYVNILAEHDIVEFRVGTLTGSDNVEAGCDPAVQIQAYNDIKNFCADRIIAGEEGVVNILAGIDADGNVSGEMDENGNLEAGSIENMVIGAISGAGGVVNIAAGGDIESLKVCRVVSGRDGEVNIVAGGDMDVAVGRIRSWSVEDDSGEVVDTGVEFVAGGTITDRWNRIRDTYETEGQPADLPAPADLPEAE